MNNLIDNRHYKSKYGQDIIIDKLCNYHEDGIFIDIGAFDGVTFNNTFYLEKMRNWKGILTEANKYKVYECSHNRWNYVSQIAVSNIEKEEDEFFNIIGYSEILSGLKSLYNEDYFKRIQNEINQYNQKVELYNVDTRKLSSICDLIENEYKSIDLLSLSCQSSEYQALLSLENETCKRKIRLITLNTNGVNEDKIKEWFNKNDYKLKWKHEKADVYIYENDNIKFSWE
jgi:hypothetical protein